MGARKRKMKAKALKLIDFYNRPTFRQMMISYRFWTNYKNRLKMIRRIDNDKQTTERKT